MRAINRPMLEAVAQTLGQNATDAKELYLAHIMCDLAAIEHNLRPRPPVKTRTPVWRIKGGQR